MAETVSIPVQRMEPPRFKLLHVSDLEFRAPRFLVRDYLEAESLALVFGDPGCGKSFLAVDLACCIATGADFHGNPTSQGSVIYIAGEGHNGLKRRFVAWETHTGQTTADAPLYVSCAPAALCDPESAQAVVSAVDAVPIGEPPALVVIDTVARNFGPGDENSTRDMGVFVQAADAIRARYTCTVLLVHHSGHGDKARARGATALRGALDAEYRMDKDEAGTVRVEASKMKDAPFPQPLAFELRSVPLGIEDHDGREVTSAALVSTTYEPPAKPSNRKGKWQQVAMDELNRLSESRRANLERGGFDPDTARVEVDEWKQQCRDAGMSRQRWAEVRKACVDSGLVSIDHGFVRPGVRCVRPSGS
ncbi:MULTISPECIES: helicase RepA family protein [unclassified Thioalkalivibrio]|uniref:AAA family ATPase n=1 Tax=unclassified Thioalkalivibrio TaxID=2621013 RepID=UPI00037A3B8E|nr:MULTISPECIES: helicase RepA family protein [unclassified Thioalkalivibrio]